jgi:hypothetical protein
MKIKLKLTPTQLEILTPLIKAKNESENNLIEAVRLVVGKKFQSCSIQNGELEIIEPEDKKTFSEKVFEEIREKNLEENDSTREN